MQRYAWDFEHPAQFHPGRLRPALWSIAPTTGVSEISDFEHLAPDLVA